MGVSLTKGGNVSLTKQAPDLKAVTVGLGWDLRTTTGDDFDLDASAILCTEEGKVVSDRDFVDALAKALTKNAGAGDKKTGSGLGGIFSGSMD